MLKKTLIFGALIAMALSPLLPTVRADAGSWTDLTSEASWDYGSYQVSRLASVSSMQGPFELGGVVYFTQPVQNAKTGVYDKVDVTIVKNNQRLLIKDVNDSITKQGAALALDDRFIYRTPADADHWFTVSEFNPETKVSTQLIQPSKYADELSVMTLAVDNARVYTAMLHTDKDSKAVESKLSVFDSALNAERRDLTFMLTAPYQNILDVQGDNILAEFHFNDGSKQLIVIDQRTQKVTAVPGSWGEAHETLVGAHLMPNSVVEYFKDYRMYTYSVGDKDSVEPGGALLNWSMNVNDAYQISHNRMAWLNPDNILYVSDMDGVSNYGNVLNQEFNLTSNGIYFHGTEGYKGYNFDSKVWTKESFLVKDQNGDVQIGTDSAKNIWYKNSTSGREITVGFGTNPLLTDREHAMFRGNDGKVYEVTLGALLDLLPKQIQAVKASNASTVYLIANNKIWTVRDMATLNTWIKSFKEVTVVSPATMAAYKANNEDAGSANFAPGTRMKSSESNKVYVVGQNGQLHWVTTETVANSIWGNRWNQGIMTVQPNVIWNYQIGTDVGSANEIKTI